MERKFFDTSEAPASIQRKVAGRPVIFTRSVIGIFPATAGLALTAEEESLFRQQLESIRAFSKKESPIEDFACEYLEGNIKISQANRSKTYGRGDSKTFEAISHKYSGVAGYLVPTLELLKQDKDYQPHSLLSLVKEKIATITAMTAVVTEAPPKPTTTAVATEAPPKPQIGVPVVNLVGEKASIPPASNLSNQALGNTAILDTLLTLLQHRQSPVMKVVNKTRPQFNISWEGFQKFKNQMAEFGAYEGCLTELISKGEREALATIWNPYQPSATNLATIDKLLEGDTDVALHQITQAIFRANDMSGISILRCRVSRDSYGDPDVDDWLNTITNLLSTGVAKDAKAVNGAILDGIYMDYKAEVNRIKDIRQDAWKYMPTLDLVREIADILRATKFARIRERTNKHYFYTPKNPTSNSTPKDEGASGDNSQNSAGTSPVKMTEDEAKAKKFCKICKSTGSHYFMDCTKYSKEKDRSMSYFKRKREGDPDPTETSNPAKEEKKGKKKDKE